MTKSKNSDIYVVVISICFCILLLGIAQNYFDERVINDYVKDVDNNCVLVETQELANYPLVKLSQSTRPAKLYLYQCGDAKQAAVIK